jgi:hypothetical protein
MERREMKIFVVQKFCEIVRWISRRGDKLVAESQLPYGDLNALKLLPWIYKWAKTCRWFKVTSRPTPRLTAFREGTL